MIILKDATYKKSLYFSLILFIGTLFFALPLQAQNSNFAYTGQSWQSSSCERKTCSNTTCQMTKDSSGHLKSCPSGKRYDVDPNCVMNKNVLPGACMDTMPVSKITRVAETNCYRNWASVNHLGSDYAAVTGTPVTAAADGRVFWVKGLNRGGRTIMIEHEKKCACPPGDVKPCDNKFVTVYMHLFKFGVEEGQMVKKGQVIGIVGGSNYLNGQFYDYPDPNAYGPHLHFEIHSGGSNKGYNKLKESIIDPLCDDIQSFCGGCSNNVEEECLNKTNTNQWTTLSDEAKQSKSVAMPPPDTFTGYADSSSGYASQKAKCALENFLPGVDECYFCPLFKVLFNTASDMAAKAYDALAVGVSNVVIVAFALWLSVFILKSVSAIEVQKPSKMIQAILTKAFQVLIVVLILRTSYFSVIQMTITPVFNAGLKYAQSFAKSDGCDSGLDYMRDIKGFTNSDQKARGLPKSMGENIVCSIKKMQDTVSPMLGIGRQLWCVGWRERGIAIIPYLIPNFPFILTGLLLMIGGLFLLLAFPWCLVDCVLNMGIASALIPAAIGTWPFRNFVGKYLMTLWNFFMNAMFQFVFLSIILYIIKTSLDQTIDQLNAYSQDDWTGIKNAWAFWSATGLRAVVVCLLGWVFLDQAKETADHFADAPDLGVGRSTGGFFAQAAERAALGRKDKDGKRQGGALGAVKGVARTGAQAANYFAIQPIVRKNNQNKIDKIKTQGLAIKDQQGNVVAYELNKGKEKRRVEVGRDGKELLVKETFNRDGTKTRISKDHMLSVKEVVDAQGNVIQKEMAFNTKLVSHLIDDKGNVNMQMVADLKAGTRFDDKTINEAIAQEVLKKRGITLDRKFESRDVTIDQNGTLVINQTNRDGSQVTLSAAMVGENKMLTTYQSVDAKGNLKIIKDNGVQHVYVQQDFGKKATAEFGFNEAYHLSGGTYQFMDKKGVFHGAMKEEDAMLGFSEEEKQLHMQQVASGKKQAIDITILQNAKSGTRS